MSSKRQGTKPFEALVPLDPSMPGAGVLINTVESMVEKADARAFSVLNAILGESRGERWERGVDGSYAQVKAPEAATTPVEAKNTLPSAPIIHTAAGELALHGAEVASVDAGEGASITYLDAERARRQPRTMEPDFDIVELTSEYAKAINEAPAN